MQSFTYHMPTEIVFGKEAQLQTAAEIKKYGGSRVLLVSGGHSAERSGLLGQLRIQLAEAGLAVESFGGVQPNPRVDHAREGVRRAVQMKADFILAVGGGSTIDSAKAIGTGALYDGDFWDFFSGKAQPQKTLPVGVVLTLAAAGSESSNSCVILQKSTLTKRGLNTEIQRPVFALMNPELTMSLPAYQTACGATDIMAHVLERYFTNSPDVDVTDRLCEALLLTVMRAARQALLVPDDYDARAQLMWAGTLAHNNTCGVGRQGDWASHQIEHELSGLYDVAHGAGLAVVLPAWMRYTMSHDVNRFAQLAVRVFGCEMDFAYPERTALEGISRFESFLREIGMPTTLSELSAKTEDIPYLAAHTKRPNGAYCGFFVPLDTEAIEKILHIADR